jgi:hypothetical protein
MRPSEGGLGGVPRTDLRTDLRMDLKMELPTDQHQRRKKAPKVRPRGRRGLMEGGTPSIDGEASAWEPPDLVIMNMCAWAQNHTGKRELMR